MVAEGKIKDAIKGFHGDNSNLVPYLENFSLFQQQLPSPSPPLIARQIIDNALAKLREQNGQLADILYAIYWQREPRRIALRRYHFSTATLSRRQEDGLDALATIICQAEKKLNEEKRQQRLSRFPQPEHKRTFGLETTLSELVEALAPEKRNQFIILIGLGGIGKTTVAFELVERLSWDNQFDSYLLVKLRDDPYGNPRTPAEHWELITNDLIHYLTVDPDKGLLPILEREMLIRAALEKEPHLIVLDNFEATDAISHFIENLRRIVGQSVFVLTSRNQPLKLTNLYIREVQELAPDDARQLLNYQLREQQIIQENESASEVIDQLLTITRGHPQAIMLVVSLLHTMTIQDVVDAFVTGTSSPIGELYDDIFERAWSLLSENAKLLLMTIYTVAPSGGTAAHLMPISQLDHNDFISTVHELSRASLIEIRGSLTERSYSLHQLTNHFLHSKFGRK